MIEKLGKLLFDEQNNSTVKVGFFLFTMFFSQSIYVRGLAANEVKKEYKYDNVDRLIGLINRLQNIYNVENLLI